MVDTPKVVQFPLPDEEEHNRRILAAATDLARPDRVPGEWKLYSPGRAEQLGIEQAVLDELVEAQIKDREKKAREAQAAERLQETRAKRLHLSERDRKRDDDKAEKEAEREQQKAEKEAERKVKEKAKAFNNLLKLPVAQHQDGIAKLATRLGEDLAALRDEFKDFAGVADGFSMASEYDEVEPWPDPVDAAELLQGISDKLSKHHVLQPHQCPAVTLWTAQAWVHNEIATYSPILTAISAEADSGKSILLGLLARLVPKPFLSVEATGPSVYRYVDANKPTLILDEADDLFKRKSDLKHIINASWTRGPKIPRQVSMNGVWVTVQFDPFCPKALGLLDRNFPRTLRTRSILIRVVPKREDEVVEPFEYTDDFEFAALRRQCARFAADNAAALRTMQPTFPTGLNNRAAMNWKIMLAIAELGGETWAQQARKAAEQLTRTGRLPSDGMKLLGAIKTMLAESGKTAITSEDIVTELCRNPLDIWATYSKGSKITQRQVAALLDAYDIHPVSLHPTKRKDFSRQGYRLAQFTDAFARYLPEDPIIQSPSVVPRRTRVTKKKKQKQRKHKARRR